MAGPAGYLQNSSKKKRKVDYMDKPNLTKRKELASALLYELKTINSDLGDTVSEMEKTSSAFYEDAFNEKHDELEAVMENYHKNVVKIKEINNDMTASINLWYDFIKDENEIAKINFPLLFFIRKNMLYKKIKKLNEEISNLAISNRFVKEQLTVLEHQLEIKAVSLARSDGNYLEYEKLLLKQKAISEELNYLLPTIPDTCPAELNDIGIEKLIKQSP